MCGRVLIPRLLVCVCVCFGGGTGEDIFVGYADGTITMMDHNTLRPRVTFQAHSVAITALAVSPERGWLFSGGSIMKVSNSWWRVLMDRGCVVLPTLCRLTNSFD